MKIALITGSGLEDFGLGICQTQAVETDYGRVTVEHAHLGDREVYLLPRHGREHSIAPHRINYRANLAALHQLGCELIVATNAVGSLQQSMRPGEYVLPDQFLDFTRTRPLTFFEGEDGVVRHVDFTEPYCPTIRGVMSSLLMERGLPVHTSATYLCAEGPRFETPAEIRMFSAWGADVVGMTGLPEAVLAHELGLCYASLCIVTNYAAGMTAEHITHEEVNAVMQQVARTTDRILKDLVQRLEPNPHCPCHDGVPNA